MFDIASSEFLLVMLVALVVIGPKDLPRVLSAVGKWVAKARGVAAQFRSGFDEMVRESELADLEKKWKAENERIMLSPSAGPIIEAGTEAETVLSPAPLPPPADTQPSTPPKTAKPRARRKPKPKADQAP
jgi:sec-independent protein translocase protein TatB